MSGPLPLLTFVACVVLGLPNAPLRAEVVVYSVVPDGEADRAGFVEGDVLVSWLRRASEKVPASAQGSFGHALDLRLVEIEQSAIAPVTVEVDRAGERLYLDLTSAAWQMQTRPQLAGTDLEAWQRGRADGADVQAVRGAWSPLIERWRGLPERRIDAIWLSLDLARVLQDAGDLEGAEALYLESVDSLPETDLRLRALTIEQLAAFYTDRAGRLPKAMLRAQEALDLWQSVDPEGLGTLYTLRLLGFLEMELNGGAASRAVLSRQLAILRERAELSAQEGSIHHNLGYLHWLERDLVAAEAEFERSRAIADELELGPIYLRSRHLMLGVIAMQRGDLEAAEFHHRELVRIDESTDSDPANLASAYGNLGATLLRAGKLAEAESAFRHSLDIRRRIQPESLPLAMALESVAQTERLNGDLDGAMALLLEARRIGAAVEPRARVNGDVSSSIGRILRDQGKLEAARREYEAALELRRAVDPYSIHRANDAFVLSDLARERQAAAEAIGYCREGIEALDRFRASLGGTIEQQSRYGESLADRYHSCSALLLETGDPVASFGLHERGRARIQRSLLADRKLRYDGADPALLERLQDAQSSYEAALTELRRNAGAADAAASESRFRDLETAYASLEQVLAQLRQTARRQAALSEPAPSSSTEVSRAIPEGTLAVSISVGTRDTLVFAFGPRRGEFEVHRIDLRRDQVESWSDQIVAQLGRPSSLGRARLERALDGLGTELLGALDDPLQRAERLLVVPDDALFRVPFQLLRSKPERRRLVESLPVSIAPSLSLALALGSQGPPQPSTLRMAVIADPDLPEGDRGERTRRLLDLSSPLERLPATGREAERIRRLAPERVQTFTGETATEERVRLVAPTVDVLHLATHAIADDRSPMESALVLSEGGGGSGGAGLLQAWEIVETFDGIAPLVTLSACETGRGGEFRNEGLLGLVSALWFAGAEQVVASLWQVADDSTADLMAIFYRHLLAGVPTDEALRRAQLAVWKGEGDLTAREHPFYWAAFQVYGAVVQP